MPRQNRRGRSIRAHQTSPTIEITNIEQSGNILNVTVRTSYTGTLDAVGNITVSGSQISLISTGIELFVGSNERESNDTFQIDLNDGFPPESGGFDVNVQAILGDPITDSDSTTFAVGSLSGGGGGWTIASCDLSNTQTAITLEWYIDRQLNESVDVPVSVLVDGQEVYSRSANLYFEGPYTEEIPLGNLPNGREMPVTLEVGENFRECGTVTVEGDDGSAGGGDSPVNVALDCGGLPNEADPNETVQLTYDVENTGDERADVTVQLLRNGTLLDTRDVSVFPATTRTGNFYTSVGSEPGSYTFEIDTA